MKNRMYFDIGSMLDEIFEAAKNFSEQAQQTFGQGNPFFSWNEDHENIDWYPSYSYPPMNIYLTANRELVFEFALAGFDEKDIDLSFTGDYMNFSARIAPTAAENQDIRYFKRRLKLKDIEKQKYYVPTDKFDQQAVKAVFKNGILRVTVPPKEQPEQQEGIKICIIREEDNDNPSFQ